MNTARYRTALLIALLLLAGCSQSRKAFKKAEQDARNHRWDQAVLSYSKAASLEPNNSRYTIALAKAKFRASQEHFELGKRYLAQGELELAIGELQATVILDPSNQYAADELSRAIQEHQEAQLSQQEQTELEELKEKMQIIGTAPPRLDPASNIPILLKFQDEEIGKIYDALSRASGINFFYDDTLDLKKKVSIDVANVTFEKAMDILMLQNKHFYKVIDDNSIVIADDNRQKRQEYEDEVIQTFYLSNADVKDVQTILRTLLDARKVAQSAQLNAITIRDSPEKVAIARRIIEANDKAKAELVVDVELLQIDRTTLRTLGIDLTQKSIGIGFNEPQGGVPLNNLGLITRQGSWSLSPVPGFVIDFLKSDSDSKVIARPQMRVTEGEKANLHIGDRIPIPTTTFNTGATIGTNVVPITSFTYQEVGIIIEIEPRVHHNKEVTMNLAVEISNVTGSVSAGSGISQPIIGSREITTVIRLKDGETNLLAGLLQESTRKSLSGVPGLSSIPVLKRIFGSTEDEIRQTDIVLTLTPHIIRIPDIEERDLEALWIGREGNLKLKGSEGSAFGSPFGTQEEAQSDTEAAIRELVPGTTSMDLMSLTPAVLPAGLSGPETAPQAAPPAAGEPQPEPEAATPGPGAAGTTAPPGAAPPPETPGTESTPTPAATEPQAPSGPPPAEPVPDRVAGPSIPVAPFQLSLSPRVLVAQVGSDFNLAVLATGAANLSRLSFTLEWDGENLEYRSVAAGNFLGESGESPSFRFRRIGTNQLEVSTAVSTGTGVSGNGAVAMARFRATAKGAVNLRFVAAEAVDAEGNALEVQLTEGRVTVP